MTADIEGAVVALDKAMLALAVARSVLLGETSPPIGYYPGKHGEFTAASAAEVAAPFTIDATAEALADYAPDGAQ